MARKLFILLSVILLAAGCQVLGGGDQEAAQDGGGSTTDDHPIQWERDPYKVVFRAEVVGGENAAAFYAKNDIPVCTIYGDGHMILVSPDTNDVLIDQVSPETIRNFVAYLTVNERIYTYKAGADLEISRVQPVYEQITLHVNDARHVTDAFSDWDEDYFSRIVDACRALSAAPAIYEPQGAWVRAAYSAPDPGAPIYLWDGEASGIDLQALAESGVGQWYEGSAVRVIWNALRDGGPSLVFADNRNNFNVVLEVPGVTVDAPPPPSVGGQAPVNPVSEAGDGGS